MWLTGNNNNNRIQRRYSRFFTISSQRRELSQTYAQVALAQPCANHAQHIERDWSGKLLIRRTQCDVIIQTRHETFLLCFWLASCLLGTASRRKVNCRGQRRWQGFKTQNKIKCQWQRNWHPLKTQSKLSATERLTLPQDAKWIVGKRETDTASRRKMNCWRQRGWYRIETQNDFLETDRLTAPQDAKWIVVDRERERLTPHRDAKWIVGDRGADTASRRKMNCCRQREREADTAQRRKVNCRGQRDWHRIETQNELLETERHTPPQDAEWIVGDRGTDTASRRKMNCWR